MRVLIVSPHPLTWNDPGSITFASLFSTIEKCDLRQIVIGNISVIPDLTSDWLYIGTNNVPLERLGRSFIKPAQPGNGGATEVRDAMKANDGKQLLLTAYADMMPISFSNHETKWVKEFAPDVIYSTLGSIRAMKTVLWANRISGAPVVAHYMDNWLDTQYSDIKTIIPRLLILHLNREVLRKCKALMAISPHMARNYEHRFSRHFEPFMHCVDVPAEFPALDRSQAMRIAYVGGLHLMRDAVLEKIGRIIKSSGGRIGNTSISVDCFAPISHLQAYKDKLESAGVNCRRSLNPEEVPSVIAKYDCLLHVESFDESILQYTRLSISTKIPIYLAASLPILAVGPKNQAAVDYVCSGGAGIGVFDLEEESIYSALIRISNQEQRTLMGRKARSMAIANHQKSSESNRFQKTFKQILSATE